MAPLSDVDEFWARVEAIDPRPHRLPADHPGRTRMTASPEAQAPQPARDGRAARTRERS